MIRNYRHSDHSDLLQLWNSRAVALGYAPMDEAQFHTLLLGHPDFSPAFTFVLEDAGQVLGFINGCTGVNIPKGDVRGYVSCLILSEQADTDENTAALLQALEQAFRCAGKTYSAVTFFNPIHLPWVIPGTHGHQHNNAPGVAVDLPLHERMLSLGYRETTREQAMHLDLVSFAIPPRIELQAEKMAREGYTVAFYDPKIHQGLDKMLCDLQNPLWTEEITAAADTRRPLLVGLCGNTVAGFTGPIYPEPSGRGYFAGIGVSPRYEHHGLGKLLFYNLCQQEKESGARYMSLFTGETNPARSIYLEAGFQIARTFGVLIKEL